ncbi:MAG TPA: aromatic ring-hydroxylating dioxygenase subunit alpha [Gammaproteobacteria bacterium]|nr:aromatic ring-hydroxylating dioxygenase subunit alpha [Gammaproteobacteria bacterium]
MTAFHPEPAWLTPQPLERASALPAPFYTHRGTEEIERRQVFGCHWQFAAHISQLAAAGDHVVTEVAGVPLLLVRGEDGVLRAFHNVCRHRAGPLATCDGRGARAFHCRYHGWTYTLDGRLRSAPDMQDARDFDPAMIRLPEARLAVWQGLVFVALEDAPPLDAVLDGIAERIGGGFEDYVFDRRVRYEIACNWKVYVDNYLEGYHLPHVHPALNRLLDYRRYVTETAEWYSLQWSPLERTAGPYGAGEALYYFVFPNTMLNILPGRLQTNRVLPLGVDRCVVEFDYFYATGSATALAARDLEFSDAVQREDIAICEAVQQRLASGSYFAGRLNPRRERGVHHFHELLRRAYREAS